MQTKRSRADIEKGIARLQGVLDEVREFAEIFINDQFHHPELDKLKINIERTIRKIFPDGSDQLNRYECAASFYLGPITMAGPRIPIAVVRTNASKAKANSIALIESAIAELKDDLEDLTEAEREAPITSLPTPPTKAGFSRKVFIIHGHDDGSREAVARFLERLGFHPVILHEQPNKGRAIIEKFEQHADVGFAVALLTPDDECVKDGKTTKRARQNVILELGYFAGRLGRDRVCVLKRGAVEVPSDMLGLVWIDYDVCEGWHRKLAQELTAAGYDVDWGKLAS